MNTSKIYQDIDGNELTIHQMVRREPQWAAARIQAGEDAASENMELRRVLTDAMATIDDFMPNVGHCALQNYERLNRVRIEARQLLSPNAQAQPPAARDSGLPAAAAPRCTTE